MCAGIGTPNLQRSGMHPFVSSTQKNPSCNLRIKSGGDSPTPTIDEDSSTNVTTNAGDTLKRFFPGHGAYNGKVVDINMERQNGKYIRVYCDVDDDIEDMTQEDFDKFGAETRIEVGEVGHLFIKKCRGSSIM